MTTTAREYLRVSSDRSGAAASVEQQHEHNVRVAASEGWALGEPYRDDSVSASQYTRKRREDFDRLTDDLDAGRFGAHVLVVWEVSRGSRREDEWVRLANLCRDRAVKIYVTKDDTLYDPTRGRDRKALLTEALDSAYESSKISDRTKRSNAARAAEGKPHGRVPFGYRRTYDPLTRRLVGQEPHPDEAPVVRELFERLAAGHSLRGIARDFEERGVRSRSGKPFSAAALRSLAVRDAYAARRVHDPGRSNGTTTSPQAQTVPATWEAIVCEADFLAVRRMLSDPARVTTRPGRARHLLSMIAQCAECGGPLSAAFRNGRRQYQCHNGGHVRVDADELDEQAEKAMLGYLARPDVFVELTAEANNTNAAEDARGQVATLRARLDELADAVACGEVSAALAGRAESKMLADLREAEARVRELSTPPALAGLMAPGEDVWARWEEAVMATRREVARMLLAPGMLGTLRVHRRPEGRRGARHIAASERIELRQS
jgi:DNA invertase Pin-like site-specific DNA recombinase